MGVVVRMNDGSPDRNRPDIQYMYITSIPLCTPTASRGHKRGRKVTRITRDKWWIRQLPMHTMRWHSKLHVHVYPCYMVHDVVDGACHVTPTLRVDHTVSNAPCCPCCRPLHCRVGSTFLTIWKRRKGAALRVLAPWTTWDTALVLWTARMQRMLFQFTLIKSPVLNFNLKLAH